jgi:hypothetical protein
MSIYVTIIRHSNSALHECRFEKFWHVPLAHVLAYRVCKPAWILWLSDAVGTPAWGQDMLIARSQKLKMAYRVTKMRITSCVTCELPNIIKCVLIIPFCITNMLRSMLHARECATNLLDSGKFLKLDIAEKSGP